MGGGIRSWEQGMRCGGIRDEEPGREERMAEHGLPDAEQGGGLKRETKSPHSSRTDREQCRAAGGTVVGL